MAVPGPEQQVPTHITSKRLPSSTWFLISPLFLLPSFLFFGGWGSGGGGGGGRWVLVITQGLILGQKASNVLIQLSQAP